MATHKALVEQMEAVNSQFLGWLDDTIGSLVAIGSMPVEFQMKAVRRDPRILVFIDQPQKAVIEAAQKQED